MRKATLTFILFLFLPAPALGSTMLALDLSELTLAAQEVVIAEVIGERAEPVRGGIVTRVVVRVEHGVVGRSGPGDELEIVVPGGELDGVGMLVHGAPRLTLGERYLLFLRRHEPEYQIVGLSQGVYRLMRSPETGSLVVSPPENLPGLVRLSEGRFQPAEPAIPRPTPLEDVIARVREAHHGR